MTAWLTIRGRLLGELPPRSLLQIIDLDPLLDDTLAVGWPHADGRFELRFAVHAIRQDALEYERVPDRLRFDVFTEEQGALWRRRAERVNPVFERGTCDLGDVVLGPREPTEEDGLVRDRRSVRRARTSNAALTALVEEVRPYVSAWTGRPELLEGVRIELAADVTLSAEPDAEGIRDWLARQARRTQHALLRELGTREVLGVYSHRHDCIYIDETTAARQPRDALALLVAHELVHRSQFRSEPGLAALIGARSRAYDDATAAAETGRELTASEQEAVTAAFALTMALEGHANAIERLVLRDAYRFGYQALHVSAIAAGATGVLGLGILAARAAATKLRALRGAAAPVTPPSTTFEDPYADAAVWGLYAYAARFAAARDAGRAPAPFTLADVAAMQEIAATRMAHTAAQPAEGRGAFRQHLGLVAEELLYGLVTREDAELQIR